MKRALLAASLLGLPFAAHAQPVTGLYVGAGAGANFMPASKSEFITRSANPALNGVSRFKERYDTGYAGVASIGYGFGNGFRVEAEGDYRRNHHTDIGGTQQKYGGMANAFFDFDIGSPYVFPYVGAGAGYMRVDDGHNGYRGNAFAYQGIAGLALPIPWVVGLSATVEYRFMGLGNSRESSTTPVRSLVEKDYNNLNHSLMLGVRYAFNVAPPPVVAPPPAAPPAATTARSYLVFFDWDRADLTARARQIIAEAAQASTKVQTTRIEVNGYTDSSGTARYNQGLSVRRARSVEAELVRDGVPKNAISIQGFGETHPLVPTAKGVREPQNRRVEIILK